MSEVLILEDILSQHEIDRLIQATREPDEFPEADDDLVVGNNYDFTKPNKFSKEHLRGLQRIHEQFCRTFSGLMSAKLRTRFDLRYEAIDQLTFGEFVRSLPNPSVLSVLEAHPLPGSIAVQISPDTAFVLHDRLCGGPGEFVERTRGLTDIEMAVFQRQVITVLAKYLSDAWKEIDEINFTHDNIESNPQFLQIASDREIVVTISLNLEFNNMSDMFNLCIPFRTIEPIISKINQHQILFDSLQPPDPKNLEKLRNKVKTAKLPIEVVLGETTVSAGDLLNLETGDVIQLDRGRNETLDVRVGKMTKFKGTPGKLGNKLGLVITSICESQGEQNDE